jgi:hypothetical protein
MTPEQSVGPAKPLSRITSNDIVSGFNSHVMELKRRISKHNVDRFVATDVPADDLAKIGKFLSDLAILKKSEAVNRAPAMALTDNGTVSEEQSAGDVRADADLDARLAALNPKHDND